MLFLLVLAVATSIAMAEEAAKNRTWVPEVPDGMPQQWDWIQLTSLEWLKGEFIALYDDKVEFESDELDTLMIEWEDIKRVRTARIMDVRLAGRDEVKGRITVDDDVIRVMQADGTERTLTREQLVSMTVGTPKELAHWKMKISIGVNTRTGNTNVTEANLSSTFARRSSMNRFVFDTRDWHAVDLGVDHVQTRSGDVIVLPEPRCFGVATEDVQLTVGVVPME